MTDQPVRYAAPKKFVFISKKQMKWIDANRWYRQGARDAKIVSVEDITPESCSIDNRHVFTGPAQEREHLVRRDSEISAPSWNGQTH
jgi:hypothetical protein